MRGVPEHEQNGTGRHDRRRRRRRSRRGYRSDGRRRQGRGHRNSGRRGSRSRSRRADRPPDGQAESRARENNLQAIKVTFNDKILFATGKSDLSDASRSALGKFAASLAQSPETDIAIYGHTDNTGSRAVNQKLSEERAQAVANYLIGQKVDPVRITTRGLAYDSPIADNSTEEGRAQNRRVEILITANDQMIQQAQDGTLK